MNLFIYCVIGIIGVLFGSFFTLAVYRLPKGEDILYTRSYCTKCKHRLNFLDLIPVLSFIFLGGKCRYCKETISKRYIIFEILTGMLFILLAFCMKIEINNFIFNLPLLTYNILFLAILIMSIGMMKESKYFSTSTVLFGILFRTIYLVFFDVSIFKTYFLYAAELLLVCLIIYTIIDSMRLKKGRNDNFLNLSLFTSFLAYNFGIVITLIIVLCVLIIILVSKRLVKKIENPLILLAILSICILFIKHIDFLSKIYENICRWII